MRVLMYLNLLLMLKPSFPLLCFFTVISFGVCTDPLSAVVRYFDVLKAASRKQQTTRIFKHNLGQPTIDHAFMNSKAGYFSHFEPGFFFSMLSIICQQKLQNTGKQGNIMEVWYEFVGDCSRSCEKLVKTSLWWFLAVFWS